jgi:FixJ family two-component response regulator
MTLAIPPLATQRPVGVGPGPTPTVFVVDDDESVRESLELLIRSVGWKPETFGSARSFLASPVADGPGCLVLDVSLPDLDGLEVQGRLLRDRRLLPIVFITGLGDIPLTVRAMKAGAVEFLTKPLSGDVLLGVIKDAIDRSRIVLRREAELRDVRSRYESLTPRERQVMARVVAGLLNKQVSGDLRISEITVKVHRGRMMRKMRANSVPDLVRMAAALSSSHRDSLTSSLTS